MKVRFNKSKGDVNLLQSHVMSIIDHWAREKKTPGRSTIHKEVCPSCFEIRYSTKEDPTPIDCHECGVTYIKAEKGVIYPKKE